MPSLSADQRTAFDSYQKPGRGTYKGYVNDYLHGKPDKRGSFSGSKQQVAHMDAAFAQAKPTSAPVVLYRGMNIRGHAGGASGLKRGSEFTDPGYVSTTTDEGVAANFRGVTQPTVRIHVPAGSKAISVARLAGETTSNKTTMDELGPVDAKTGEDVEREVLLPRGSRFRVTGKSGKYIDAELVPGG